MTNIVKLCDVAHVRCLPFTNEHSYVQSGSTVCVCVCVCVWRGACLCVYNCLCLCVNLGVCISVVCARVLSYC